MHSLKCKQSKVSKPLRNTVSMISQETVISAVINHQVSNHGTSSLV